VNAGFGKVQQRGRTRSGRRWALIFAGLPGRAEQLLSAPHADLGEPRCVP